MRLLITGGSGFIGRNLKEQLQDIYEIYAPTRAELDLLDPESVREYVRAGSFDAVVHSATWDATRTSVKDPAMILEHNLRMFFNVARCKEFFGKMIYYGSAGEYDRGHWQPKMKEDYFDRHVPSDQYGFSKYIMRKYAERSDTIYDLCLFGVFGRYEDWRIRFISNAISLVLRDRPIEIRQNSCFDYLYVDDLVRLTRWFIENKPGEKVYNICTGSVNDLLTLARRVLKISGKKT